VLLKADIDNYKHVYLLSTLSIFIISPINLITTESLGEKHALMGSDGNRIEKAHYDVVGQQLLVRIY
jgi:hypothetical protein